MNTITKYQNGGVTEKTDKQANKLVKKRTKVKKRLKRIEDRQKEGKKTLLPNLRKKVLKNRKEKIQTKIDENPTAQKWKKDDQEEQQEQQQQLEEQLRQETPPPPPRQRLRLRRRGRLTPQVKKKYQKGGEKKEVDYNSALSALGLIPAIGTVGKASGKLAKAGKLVKKGAVKKGKKVRSPLNSSVGEKLKKFQKKVRRQTGGVRPSGSFIEPGMEQI